MLYTILNKKHLSFINYIYIYLPSPFPSVMIYVSLALMPVSASSPLTCSNMVPTVSDSSNVMLKVCLKRIGALSLISDIVIVI